MAMKNVTNEKDVLLQYIDHKYKDPKLALTVLDIVMSGSTEFNKAERDVAEFISKRTSYFYLVPSSDVNVEVGDWGIPHIDSVDETSLVIDIEDQDSLSNLRRELDDELNKTSEKISNFLSKNTIKWECKGCSRFLGKELSSIDEVQSMLENFRMGKYWKCRSCKTLNYFTFDSKGIEFKSKLD